MSLKNILGQIQPNDDNFRHDRPPLWIVANPPWHIDAVGGRLHHQCYRIVEVGGPGTLSQSIKAVAVGGHISVVSVLAKGEIPGIMDMFLSQATFQPIATGSRRDLEDMLRVVAQHEIRPVIDSSHAFEEAKTAWTHFAGRDLFGKVVISHAS